MTTEPEAPQDDAPLPAARHHTNSAPDGILSSGDANSPANDASRLAPARRADDFHFNDGPDEDMDGNTSTGVIPANGSSPALRFLGLLALACGIFWLGSWATSRSNKPPLSGPIAASNLAGTAVVPKLVVHVAGRVRKPGVYTLRADARIADAIRQAGGPLRDADVNALNLAAWVEDGTRIEVPAKVSLAARPLAAHAAAPRPIANTSDASTNKTGTADTSVSATSSASNASNTAPPEDDATVLARLMAASPARRAPSAATQRSKAPKPRKSAPKTIAGMPRGLTKSGKPSNNASPAYLAQHPLDLNTASAAQLEALPGVGPAMAQKMLAYREQNGGFKSVDDLDEVPGIGEKKLETLRPLVTVK